MALLVGFRKTREDAEQVEYQFGYPEMNRRLVIDKGSLTGRPVDTTADSDSWAVLSKILRIHRTKAIWPDRGSYAA